MAANLAILFILAQEDIGFGHVIHFPAALLADEWFRFALSFRNPKSLAKFFERRVFLHKTLHKNIHVSTCSAIAVGAHGLNHIKFPG